MLFKRKYTGDNNLLLELKMVIICVRVGQLRVFAHNIVESSEVTSGITKLGEYELHDLVTLE